MYSVLSFSVGPSLKVPLCYVVSCLLSEGHIQISQIPDRDEPSDNGKIKFTSFFKMLEEIGYDGWVAGEYHPAGEVT